VVMVVVLLASTERWRRGDPTIGPRRPHGRFAFKNIGSTIA